MTECNAGTNRILRFSNDLTESAYALHTVLWMRTSRLGTNYVSLVTVICRFTTISCWCASKRSGFQIMKVMFREELSRT
jgi:hypothetical protein